VSTNIPLSCADITNREIRAASDALQSKQLTLGSWTSQFEKSVALHAGSTYGISTNSAHSAMHILLESMGIQQGQEIILSAFAFPATAATIIRMGAIPVFADCDVRSLNMNSKDVSSKITSNTKAIIASHTFGNPSGIESIACIAQEQEISLIEDAHQAIGSKINTRQVGSFGRAAVFGFHSTAQLTSVEGGVITTDDDALAKQCQERRNHGFSSDPALGVQEVHQIRTGERMISMGYDYKLSEVHAAVGTVQMQRYHEIMQQRNQLARWYTRRLGGVTEITCPTIDAGIEMSWDGYVIRLNDNYTQSDRDEIIRGLHRHEIGAADYFQSIPTLPAIAKHLSATDDCPVSNSISERTIALPFYTAMTQREVSIVAQTLELMLTRSNFGN